MGRTVCTEPQSLYTGELYLHLFFTNQDEGTTFLPNVGNYSPNGDASHPRRHDSWKPSHSQFYLQTPGNTKGGEDGGGSVGNLFRLWTATNDGTVSVTGITPEYISVVLQVKTSLFLSFRRVLNSISSFLGDSQWLSSSCRRFGTHCRFHLHRQVNEVYILHSPAYEDGTDSEFRNVRN